MLYRAQFPQGIFMDLDRLQREMQQAFNFPSNIRGRSWDTYPATNVGHTPNSVEIFVFLPGVEPSQIELHLEKGVLVVAGQRNIDVADKDEKAVMHIEERFAGQFRRVVTLPDDIDPNQVDARYRDGVLHICIQRREAATPRQITIQ